MMSIILAIDDVIINFSPSNILVMNIAISIIMFGVALDMRLADFKSAFAFPRAALVGLISQFILLPAFTYLLVILLDPPPSIAMGMFLIAACPGGNFSNFLTHLAKGNVALSVSMSAISTVFSVIMTPLNFTFWGNLHPQVAQIFKEISIQPSDIILTIVMILGIPLALGLFIAHRFHKVAHFLKKPMKIFSIIFFICFVLFALIINWNNFVAHVSSVFFIVLIHNTTALAIGYFCATLLNVSDRDRKAITIEVGIQNSGLGLTLIFTFFHGLGGMAIIACWWGIWHIIAGLTIATFWLRKE